MKKQFVLVKSKWSIIPGPKHQLFPSVVSMKSHIKKRLFPHIPNFVHQSSNGERSITILDEYGRYQGAVMEVYPYRS